MRKFLVFTASLLTAFSFSYALQPVIRIFPSSPADFGPTTIDTTKTTDFAITNIGDPTAGPLRVCGVSVPSGFENFKIVADGCSGSSLNYGVSCTISVRFEPHQKLAYSGTLAVVYDDDGDTVACNTQKTATINLTGRGVAIKISGAGCDPSRFICDFSDVNVGTNAYKTVKVCNASGDPLFLLNPAFNLIENPVGDIPSYGIVTTNCNGASLNFFAGNTDDCVNNYCELSLAFSPHDVKDYFGTVNINDANGGPGGSANVGIFLRGSGSYPSADIDFGTVPLGSFIDRFVNITFTCPDNGNGVPGETITLPASLVSVSGTYFSLTASSCPTSCIENQTVSCNVAVRFQPFTSGVFTGNVIIAVPNGTSIQRTLVGRGGPATQNFLSLSSSSIDFGVVPRFSSVGKVIVVRNITSSTLEFNVAVAGSGFFTNVVGCTCNDNYVSNGAQCIPNTTPPLPTSIRAYKLRPGEVCSVAVGFSPPLSARGTLGGVLIFDTQAQAVSVPMTAQVAVSNPPTTPPSLPSVGSGGGGCSMGYGNASLILAWLFVPLAFLVKRMTRRK